MLNFYQPQSLKSLISGRLHDLSEKNFWHIHFKMKEGASAVSNRMLGSSAQIQILLLHLKVLLASLHEKKCLKVKGF